MCHGDLKFNNILFAGSDEAGAERPLCLIDLDTLGPMPLAFELGDAWRSWCNRNGENNPQAALDLGVFRASLEGYREGLGRALTPEERMALLLGLDWVSVELGKAQGGVDAKRSTSSHDHSLASCMDVEADVPLSCCVVWCDGGEDPPVHSLRYITPSINTMQTLSGKVVIDVMAQQRRDMKHSPTISLNT